MYIAHSLVLKYFIFTLPGTAQFFESLGLPGAAYLTFWAELIGGVLLVPASASRRSSGVDSDPGRRHGRQRLGVQRRQRRLGIPVFLIALQSAEALRIDVLTQ